ncbi:hypothetical protein I6F66_08010 [Pseudoalteromonas sp. NZS100_1]|uniref:hypothetical protein n=1 Tax=Pseudoalteromonas sp. NZS100_1 TaxID=2792073 RepID=UPI0018CEE5C3|nr:hypothetical protein [Pseudoalteromonas sp. NZS100_1]MBH0012031.1 hypothetical protein [Pseudoalteromonas sp. NZS100_1]
MKGFHKQKISSFQIIKDSYGGELPVGLEFALQNINVAVLCDLDISLPFIEQQGCCITQRK